MKHAFTLIELLMVIAIIAIISTLAVNKVGGVREAAARKMSLANAVAVERAVGAYLAGGGRLDRLDSLVSAQGDAATPWRHGTAGFDCTYTNFTAASRELYLGPTRAAGDVAATALEGFRADCNGGVTPELAAVLCPYTLDAAEAQALGDRLGLRYVMAHNEYPCDPASSDAYGNDRGGDGAYLESFGDGKDPNVSGCCTLAVTNAMTLFAINPVTDRGRAIYRSCGQLLLRTEENAANYNEAAAVAEVASSGGPLLALGLGDTCTAVGSSVAGLESAPYATYTSRQYYARYILLIRLRKSGAAYLPEFAGVIDPCGRTVKESRETLRNL